MSGSPAATVRRTVHVASSIEAIGPLSLEIERFFGAHGASTAAVSAISLAVEELVTNAVSYGCPPGGVHAIRVDLTLDPIGLTAVVADAGRAYNPLEQPAPDTEAALEDRAIGGLGVHLVRQLMDDVHYERRNGRNIVTLRKRDPRD